MTELIHRDGPKNGPPAFLVAGIVIVTAIVLANAWPKPAGTPTLDVPASPSAPEVPETADTSVVSTGFLQPDAFAPRERAEKYINLNQGKSGADLERIVAGVVVDPTDAEGFYFATSSPGAVQAGRGHFVGIYRYDAKSAFWQRLYKTTYPNEGGATTLLRVIGLDGDRLIVTKDALDEPLGPCASIYARAAERGTLLSLSRTRPLDGLKPYESPDALLQTEHTREEACRQSR